MGERYEESWEFTVDELLSYNLGKSRDVSVIT